MGGGGDQGGSCKTPSRHPIIRHPSFTWCNPPAFCLFAQFETGWIAHMEHMAFFPVISLATVARHDTDHTQHRAAPTRAKPPHVSPRALAVLDWSTQESLACCVATSLTYMHRCRYIPYLHMQLLASWPGLVHVLPRPGNIEITARPVREGTLPRPLRPSHRAAEISDILAGSWWNLRRI